ncbi:MAG TPA: DUF2520 domain-containing protein [Flavobacterium sp.]|nr:DUF2520 domain-containing protein [Flavobacterium sp.]
MKTINIIGSGNVAYHLMENIDTLPDFRLQQVAVRSKEKVLDLVSEDLIVTDIKNLNPADLTIIAVTDDAIKLVSDEIPYQNHLVVHTSGTTSMQILNDKNRKGVFYPLQTFSKSRPVDFKNIPLCLETEQENDLKYLKVLAQQMSGKVYEISSEQRKSLHVSAVFVSNFVNHMYAIGDKICEENNIPFEILHPLIQETAVKITSLSPEEAQTGPAVRHDEKTITAHQNFLTNETFKNIYKLITESIQNV